MKIKFAVTSITIMLTVICSSVLSFAATFETNVDLTADDNGVITFTSGGDGIVTLVQFCPQEWVTDCDSNIIVNRDGNTFELDKDGLKHHQTAFNFFDDSSKKWLLIPNQGVVRPDQNIKIITDEKEGKRTSYFLYIGAASK